MKNRSNRTQPALTLCALAVASACASQAFAEDNLPDMGSSSEPWTVDTFYENHTAFRGRDDTGKVVGLSKFRNTMQVEADKKLDKGWAFHGGFWNGGLLFGQENASRSQYNPFLFGTAKPDGQGREGRPKSRGHGSLLSCPGSRSGGRVRV